MDRSDVINLIKPTLEQNDFGGWDSDQDSITRTEVFCDVKSITQTEWFEAGRNGIEHPAFVFVMNRNEYSDERIVEYKGQLYGVYRTYEAKNENLELYVEAKGGLHVEED